MTQKTLHILLTGASGYLGQHILHALLTTSQDVVVCALYHRSSALSHALQEYPHILCQALDLTDETAVKHFLASTKHRWDVCIHTAAMASPRACQQNPSLAMAINNPTVFFQALQQHNPVLRMITLSTDQLYEGTNPPYLENSPTAPVNVYSSTKRAMEKDVQHVFPQTAIILRSSILLGPPAPFVPAHDTFLHFVNSRPPPQQTVYWTDERRNVLAVQDAVEIIVELAYQNTVGIYNMGGPVSYSRMQLAQAVFAHQRYDPSESLQPAVKAQQPVTTTTTTKNDVPSPLDISMQSTKLMQILPSRSFRTLSEMIQSTFPPKIIVVHQGFQDIRHKDSNPSGRLVWRCAPDSWSPALGREGRGGSWNVTPNNQLILYPAAKKDYWRKTYYEPILLKDDGAVLEYPDFTAKQHYTVEAKFDLVAAAQFDQAGIFIRVDPQHWIKAGIEVVDGTPRLSCVVTNEYSDWSTQSWNNFQKLTPEQVLVPNVEVRVHCRGTSFVVEAKIMEGRTWDFIRIAHMNGSDTFAAGVFACCPEDQRGGFATFHEFRIVEGSQMEHNADGNHESL